MTLSFGKNNKQKGSKNGKILRNQTVGDFTLFPITRECVYSQLSNKQVAKDNCWLKIFASRLDSSPKRLGYDCVLVGGVKVQLKGFSIPTDGNKIDLMRNLFSSMIKSIRIRLWSTLCKD